MPYPLRPMPYALDGTASALMRKNTLYRPHHKKAAATRHIFVAAVYLPPEFFDWEFFD